MHTAVAADMQLPASINGHNAKIFNCCFSTITRAAGYRKLYLGRSVQPLKSFFQPDSHSD
ncbi:hypothetical protein D3C72_2555810 [compost metagenome]